MNHPLRLFALILAAVMALGACSLAESAAPSPTPVTRPNVVMLSFPTVSIQADTLDVNVYFPNSPKNAGWYDLVFTLWAAIPEEAVQEDVETTVYSLANPETGAAEDVIFAKLFVSEPVPAGMCLERITLNQPVPEGTYRAILSVQSYYADTGLPTKTGANTLITLNVIRPETDNK